MEISRFLGEKFIDILDITYQDRINVKDFDFIEKNIINHIRCNQLSRVIITYKYDLHKEAILDGRYIQWTDFEAKLLLSLALNAYIYTECCEFVNVPFLKNKVPGYLQGTGYEWELFCKNTSAISIRKGFLKSAIIIKTKDYEVLLQKLEYKKLISFRSFWIFGDSKNDPGSCFSSKADSIDFIDSFFEINNGLCCMYIDEDEQFCNIFFRRDTKPLIMRTIHKLAQTEEIPFSIIEE